jgi:hypothetical protein
MESPHLHTFREALVPDRTDAKATICRSSPMPPRIAERSSHRPKGRCSRSAEGSRIAFLRRSALSRRYVAEPEVTPDADTGKTNLMIE